MPSHAGRCGLPVSVCLHRYHTYHTCEETDGRDTVMAKVPGPAHVQPWNACPHGTRSPGLMAMVDVWLAE